jgi:hypothetical protein
LSAWIASEIPLTIVIYVFAVFLSSLARTAGIEGTVMVRYHSRHPVWRTIDVKGDIEYRCASAIYCNIRSWVGDRSSHYRSRMRMSSALSELQARQIIQRMHRLREQVDLFAIHAKTLVNSPTLDGRVLLQEANNLTRSLMASRTDFEAAAAYSGTLSRTLSSRPSAGGGMAPAALWGSELRAGSKQFGAAVQKAEDALRQLFNAADLKMSSPIRTQTGIPDNPWEAALNLIELLTEWLESRKRRAS